MEAAMLGPEQKAGVKASIVVVLLILVLFLVVLVSGQPIMQLQSEQFSVAYSLAIYIPVLIMCLAAYRKAKRA